MTTAREGAHTTKTNERLAFADVNMPGTYVDNETGHLFRVPEDALVGGRSPLIEIVSKSPTMVTRISEDPWLPISKARQTAADSDLYISF